MSDAVMIELDREDVERHFRVRGGRGTRAVDKALRAALDTPAPEQSQVSSGLSDADCVRLEGIALFLDEHPDKIRSDAPAFLRKLAEHPSKGDELREKMRRVAGMLEGNAELAAQEAIRLGAEGDHHGEFEAKGIEVARREAAMQINAALTEASADPEGDGQ